MATWRKSYTGPVKDRAKVNGKAAVSAEELADFKRQYGSDMTLRDLLNMDKDEFALKRQAEKSAKAAGAYRGQRSMTAEKPSEAPKKPSTASEDGGMMGRLRKAGLTPSGASEVGAGKSALAALGMAGGVAGRMGGKAVSTAAKMEPRIGRPVTTRLDDAAAAFSKPKAAEVTKETGRKFTAAQEREAAEAAVRGAAARKKMAETKAGRSRAMEEAKKESMMRADKKKPSPRSRTRDEEDIEFAKGGYAAKRKK
jgi:hypothetical protein